MKRKIVLIVLLILGILYLQFGRSPKVDNITTHSDSEGYTADLTVTVNKIGVFNREKMTQILVEKIVDNDFQNMQFCYDAMGYPDEIKVTVYANNFTKHFGFPAFEFRYVTEKQ